MQGKQKICTLLVLLAILCVLALIAAMLDWPIKQYAWIPLSIFGLLIFGGILLWDWNRHKKDSTDRPFRLRRDKKGSSE